MSCAKIQNLLDEYVDGELPESSFQDVEAHLASCDGCREEERRLRSFVEAAATLPRQIEPRRDLWPGIAGRIDNAKREPRPAARVRPWWGSPLGLAAAAAFVMVLGVFLARGRWHTNAPSVVEGTLVPAAVSAGGEAIAGAERSYATATAELMAAVNARRDSFSPETLAAIDKNLLVIDDSLKQLRDAIQKDPGRAELQRMLVATHQKKVDMLRLLVQLNVPL
jgi:predicted anti-sigma-YlaC factor YlaD